DAVLVELQAINQRLGQATLAAFVDIALVGLQNRGGLGDERVGCREEDAVLPLGGVTGQLHGDGLGAAGLLQDLGALGGAGVGQLRVGSRIGVRVGGVSHGPQC